MKEYVFPYYIWFGTNDAPGSEIACSISDKDAKRLENSAKEGGRFHLDEDDEIEDIYKKIYNKAILAEKEILRTNPEIVSDWFSWDDNYTPSSPISEDDIDRYLDELTIVVNYPRELQLLEKSIVRRAKQSNYETVTIDRTEVKDYVSGVDNKTTKIVYTDNGKTLYWVPWKYSGKFVVNECVTSIDKYAFHDCSKITDIILPEGLTEIEESTFSKCESLKQITIPSTVTSIGFNAFFDCKSLEDIKLNEGLIELNYSAFRWCFSLKEIRIPETVKEINGYFPYNASFKDIYFLGEKTKVITGDNWNGVDCWRMITVHALPGSEAEKFAVENNIKFKTI